MSISVVLIAIFVTSTYRYYDWWFTTLSGFDLLCWWWLARAVEGNLIIKVPAFELLAQGRVKTVLFSQTSNKRTFHI